MKQECQYILVKYAHRDDLPLIPQEAEKMNEFINDLGLDGSTFCQYLMFTKLLELPV